MSPTIWNHTVKGSYPPSELAGISAAYLYATRALCCTQPGDIIQLPDEVRGELPWIAAHYDRIGVPHATEVIWSLDLERAAAFPAHEFSVFLYAEPHFAARPDERWRDAARRMNCKNEFIRLCLALGLPVPETVCFDNNHGVDAALGEIPVPAYRKTAVSASGVGVLFCEDRATLESDVHRLPAGVPFQIQQPILAPLAFINVQYGIDADGKAVRIGISEQILEGNSHEGNRFPSVHDTEAVWAVCDPAAQAIAAMGMKGIFAFDVAIDARGNPVLIECNPRFNACTYYWTVANRLGARSWFFRNQKVKPVRLEDLNLTGIEYDPATKKGVVIVLWGTVLMHRVGVLYIADSDAECQELQVEFLRRNGY